MKRQAAIVGPTPAMIRWTVVRDCGLRDLEKLPEPEAAARQLNGLAEWARSKKEQRIHDGICWHENCDVADDRIDSTQLWMGFPESEPFVVFGSQDDVVNLCLQCPANVDRDANGIAGCWGTIPFSDRSTPTAKSTPDVLRLATGVKMPVMDCPAWLDANLLDAELALMQSLFPATRPAWYGLWCVPEWNRDQLQWGANFLGRVAGELPSIELRRFASAVHHAHTEGLRFCVQAIPPGFSDGLTWTLQPHCGLCMKFRIGRAICSCCGEYRAPMPEARKKVLGLRPWLRLANLLGPEAAAAGVNSYRKHRRAKFEN